MSARIRTGATALLVCVACGLGAAIGSALRFPHTGTAILYPPFAIVTTALLLSPPRRWWIYLLAGSVGTFVVASPERRPVSFVLMTEIANYARALLAALGRAALRRFGRAPRHAEGDDGVSSLRRRPRALRGRLHRRRRRGAARRRLPGPLAAVAAVERADRPHAAARPADRARPAGGEVGWVPLHRWREAGILLIALLGVGGLVLLDSNASGASLYAPLPLLLWAAVRFGPGGTSAALLTVAILAITGTLGERGPFVTQIRPRTACCSCSCSCSWFRCRCCCCRRCCRSSAAPRTSCAPASSSIGPSSRTRPS